MIGTIPLRSHMVSSATEALNASGPVLDHWAIPGVGGSEWARPSARKIYIFIFTAIFTAIFTSISNVHFWFVLLAPPSYEEIIQAGDSRHAVKL